MSGGGMYVALAGAVNQATVMETTAENLSNATTDGYQRMRTIFRNVLAQTGKEKGPAHRYPVISENATDRTAGVFRQTGRPLDAALPKETYLAVGTDRGERYTRAVSLNVARDGTVKTAQGHTVLGENGKPVKVDPAVQLTLSADGELRGGDQSFGRIRLVSFSRPETLTREGGSLLAGSGATGAATAAKGAIDVGALEESNASVIESMTDMVKASREFETYKRAIESFNEADRRVTRLISAA